jgi:hypothetical protein
LQRSVRLRIGRRPLVSEAVLRSNLNTEEPGNPTAVLDRLP